MNNHTGPVVNHVNKWCTYAWSNFFNFLDWVAYWWGWYGCSSPSTKGFHILCIPVQLERSVGFWLLEWIYQLTKNRLTVCFFKMLLYPCTLGFVPSNNFYSIKRTTISLGDWIQLSTLFPSNFFFSEWAFWHIMLFLSESAFGRIICRISVHWTTYTVSL